MQMLVAARGVHRLDPVGELSLKGLPEPMAAWQVRWEPTDETTLRVALADDSGLLREGIARALGEEGIDVVLQASDAEELLAGLAGARPHAVVVDVRMPPTHTTEGIDAAEQIKADHPEIGVLVLSATLQEGAARRLLDGHDRRDRLPAQGQRRATSRELAAAVRTVASGGSAIAPDVVARLAP